MADTRVIKRYANRKMYDTARSCYVTLEEVADMVRNGADVQVIDNKSKEDLTEVTLTQALLDSERRNRGTVPLHGLRHLIASGGDLLQKKVAEPVLRVREGAERTVATLKGDAERTVATLKGDAERTVATLKGDAERTVTTWRDEAARTVTAWKSEAERRAEKVLHRREDHEEPDTHEALLRRLEALEQRVQALEAERGQRTS